MFKINCCICGQYTDKNRIFLSNRLIICNKCFKQLNGFTCNKCYGKYIKYDYDQKYNCCKYCADSIKSYDQQSQLRIHNYFFKPYPTFYSLDKSKKGLFMGIQLQIGGAKTPDIVNKFAANNESNFCYIKKDTSIPLYGCEIVSYPATLQYHLSNKTKWKSILKNARQLHFKSYNINNCGLHIHVNKNYFDNKSIQKLDYFINTNQEFFSKLSKRVSTFARFLTKPINSYGIPINYNRHCALNLCNENTIQFRLFRGTLNYKSFISYIELVHYICKYIQSNELQQLNTCSFLEYIKEQPTKYLISFINKAINGVKNGQ